jgi:putative hydrolase of the HAD superfamily
LAVVIDPALVADVDLLCLDAGNTVIFLDHARLARLCHREGFATTAQALERAEGAAKHAHEHTGLRDFTWSHAHLPAARGWARTLGTILACAGLEAERLPVFADRLWPDHCARNLWCSVPDGLPAALIALRARGVRVAIISNSEGMLAPLFADLGVAPGLDLVVDSGIVGIEKPDPRIFQIALDTFGLSPARTLHLGDNYTTDVLGARAAGVRIGLVDPFGHLAGRHLDVPRVPGAVEVARAIAGTRGR